MRLTPASTQRLEPPSSKLGASRLVPSALALGWFCLGVLTLWTYRQVPTMGYVLWDDQLLIQENALLRMPFCDMLAAAFGGFYSGDYLPLTLLSFWTEVHVFGYQPQLQHSVNLALHVLNIWLLSQWTALLPSVKPWRLLICAVFALHPLQVESVAWISERKGLLATSFYFAAVWAALRPANGRRAQARMTIAYWILFTCGLLAKANALLLPIWLFWSTEGSARSRRQRLLRHGPPLAVAMAFGWIRVTAYASSVPELQTAALSSDHLLNWPLMTASAVGFYLRTVLWPSQLAIIYPSYHSVELWATDRVIGIAGLLAMGASLFWVKRSRPWLLLVACLMLPVLQLIPRLNFVNDRYAYIPIVAVSAWLMISSQQLLAMLPAGCFKQKAALRYLSLAACGVAAGAAAYASAARVAVWSSNLALWSATVAQRPDSGLAWNNLGQAHAQAGDLAAAVAAYGRSIAAAKLQGHDNSAYNNLAMLHSNRDLPAFFDLPRAQALLSEGIAQAGRPEEAFILRFNLALTELQSGDLTKGRATFVSLLTDLQKSQNQRYLFLAQKAEQMLQNLPPP